MTYSSNFTFRIWIRQLENQFISVLGLAAKTGYIPIFGITLMHCLLMECKLRHQLKWAEGDYAVYSMPNHLIKWSAESKQK